mgnify:CR=1 FL=1
MKAPLPVALAALAAATLAAAPAAAGEARASGNANVYAGPGDHYRIIDQLEDGESYEVLDCTRRERFCFVADLDGEELGWVRGSYLVGGAAKTRVTPFEFLVTPDFFRKHP